MRKMKISDIIINLIGAIVVFAFFSIEPLIEQLINGSYFIFPWWGWGILGVVIFEIVYSIFLLKPSNKNKF